MDIYVCIVICVYLQNIYHWPIIRAFFPYVVNPMFQLGEACLHLVCEFIRSDRRWDEGPTPATTLSRLSRTCRQLYTTVRNLPPQAFGTTHGAPLFLNWWYIGTPISILAYHRRPPMVCWEGREYTGPTWLGCKFCQWGTHTQAPQLQSCDRCKCLMRRVRSHPLWMS